MASNSFRRGIAADFNDMKRSLGALLGIAQGLICDQHLSDAEIHFLSDWLRKNEMVSLEWPGDIIQARVAQVLSDGVITEDERSYLSTTLQQLIGGTCDDLAGTEHVTELAFDSVTSLRFPDSLFCFTGEFVYAPRAHCASTTERRGGRVSNSVTKRLNYLIVGSLGSREWKHGSFGTKIDQAIRLKREGATVLIVTEDIWASSLSPVPPDAA
jgi:NAD-dependent DNA ligase